MRSPVSPLGAVVRGAAAGGVGTFAMDAVWYRRYRKGGGTQTFLEWEFSSGLSSWDGAPAPALVGKRLYEGLFQKELSPRWAGLTNTITHWGTGIGWGAQYGILAGSLTRVRAQLVAAESLGPTAWATSYAVLPLARLYEPVWDYGVKTLAKDFSAHVVYGKATAVTFWLFGGCRSVLAEKAKRA